MAITLKLLQNYYTPIKPETGLCITYDIKEMRNNTAKLEKWYKQRYIKTEEMENHAETWEELRQRIHQGLKECYPYNPKKTHTPHNINNGEVRKNRKK